MSTTAETNVPNSTLVESNLPTSPTIPDVCKTGDKECIARLVQAFSDCE